MNYRQSDSLLHRDDLNATVEAKDSGEPRVREKLAHRIMAKNPALNTAFENQPHNDPAFTAGRYARRNFFYLRSP